jgi:hypothetical protein
MTSARSAVRATRASGRIRPSLQTFAARPSRQPALPTARLCSGPLAAYAHRCLRLSALFVPFPSLLTGGCSPDCRDSRMDARRRLAASGQSSRAAALHHTLRGCGTAALHQRCACIIFSRSHPRSLRLHSRPHRTYRSYRLRPDLRSRLRPRTAYPSFHASFTYPALLFYSCQIPCALARHRR